MRQFYLKNSSGEEKQLTTKALFIYKPQGLGMAYNSSYGTQSDGFFAPTSKKIAQGSIAGEFVFTANPYTEYKELIDWVATSSALKVGYKPIDGPTYYAHADLAQVTKTERRLTGELVCPFVLKLLSPWAEETPYRTAIAPSASALTYPQEYPRTYGSIRASGETEAITLSGHIDGAVEVKIAGPLTNPIICLLGWDGSTWAERGRMAYTGTIAAGTTLHLSTMPQSSGVWTETSGAVTDGIANLTLTNNNFFRLPLGQSLKLSLSADGTVPTTADICIYDYYLTV